MRWCVSAAVLMAAMAPQGALAGSVFVNGVNVDGLRDQTFENATVTLDSQGNVIITAPNYQIQVAGGTTPPTGPAATVPPPAPVPPPPPPPTGGVAPGRWWLVTEDNGSQGHNVDVVVNGTTVRTVRSGDAQLILDLGPWLHPGANQIRVVSNSVNASGGTMYVYVGAGSNAAGTVDLVHPSVQYGLGSSRVGAYSRDYTVDVGS